jgi:hypothetical protein
MDIEEAQAIDLLLVRRDDNKYDVELRIVGDPKDRITLNSEPFDSDEEATLFAGVVVDKLKNMLPEAVFAYGEKESN